MNEPQSAADAIRLLRAGNARYVSQGGSAFHPTINKKSTAQVHPAAAIVVCSDLQPVPEHVFGLDPGELIIMQTPANIVGDGEVAGALLAKENDGISLAVVLGHSFCSVIELNKPGNESPIDALSQEIEESRSRLSAKEPGPEVESTAAIARSHALRMAEVLHDRLGDGSGITVVAALLEDATGEVEFL